ncbi:hypothetical protein U91I_02398 [alpha proteobacterium U9-1i]|nr:hypothetical protein U91I_02398 [alpha proteobacterium U9-1i]
MLPEMRDAKASRIFFLGAGDHAAARRGEAQKIRMSSET